MRALVINCSEKQYNLGASKLTDWLRTQGYDVDYCNGDPQIFALGYDLVCLSVIFSWHAPIARDIALRVKHQSEVWCGGPGMTALKKWWAKETGLDCVVGLDQRFERQSGDYKMTFASRGCSVGCWFCIVPIIEGKEFTLYWDFKPAPMLCDNNLSALPEDFQAHIVRRYQETNTVLADANSGFEPATFDIGTYERWKPIVRTWRFAFDEMQESREVETMLKLLKSKKVASKHMRVYVLIGNEPFESCYERVRKVLEWGGEPFCQFIRPLNWLGGKLPTKHDWTEQMGRDFCRYFNTFLFRSVPLWEYAPRADKSSLFNFLAPVKMAA